MRRSPLLALLFIFLENITLCAAGDESISFGRFGTVTLYRQTQHPSRVALFVSGEGGWNQGVVDIAKVLSSRDALVVGIDMRHYLKELETSDDWCSYPGGDFDALSKFIQKKFAFPNYVLPVLVGYGSGATLAYATLAQAPPNMFRGVLSLGFCPDLSLKKPLCQWNALNWKPGPQGKSYSFLPAPTLQAPWIVVQGTSDIECDATAAETYVKQVREGAIVLVPHLGHAFSPAANWMPQVTQAFMKLVRQSDEAGVPQADELKDLPLVEVPTTGPTGDTLAVILSGDGGWASIDRELGNTLAAQGVPVAGLNSLQYFWTRRTPEGATRDLERVLRYYFAAWHTDKAILIGYSRGADVLPFMANRLPSDLLARVQLVALLGPGQAVDFEFHLTDWLGDSARKTARPVLPEVAKLKGTKVLCFYGSEEEDSLCKNLDATLAKTIVLKGGHHFAANYPTLAEAILQEARDMGR